MCVSPLARTLHTASVIQSYAYSWWEQKPLLEIVPDLYEIDYGSLDGKTWQQIYAIYPNAREIYDGSKLDTVYPDGEKIADARTRVVSAMIRVLNNYPEESILFVAHGGTHRLFLSWVLQTDRIRTIIQDNTALSIVEQNGENFSVTLMNSTAHLLK